MVALSIAKRTPLLFTEPLKVLSPQFLNQSLSSVDSSRRNMSSSRSLALALVFTLCSLSLQCGAADIPVDVLANKTTVVRGSVDPSTPVVYSFSYNPIYYFILARLNSTSVNITASIENSTTTWLSSVISGIRYIVLRPGSVASACAAPPCKYLLTASSAVSRSFEITFLQGPMMTYGATYSNTLVINNWKYYGVEVSKDDLDVLITLRPDQDSSATDLDLFVFGPRNPFVFFRPSSDSPNHYKNYEETTLIKESSSYYSPGLYIIQVLAPSDTDVTNNFYSVFAERNYEEPVLLSLFGIFGALTVLVLCLFSAAAILARRRRAAAQMELRVIAVPVESGASQSQIDALKKITFAIGMYPAEDSKCAVCLSDYSEGSNLRLLPCSHHFHQDCIDAWLKHKKHCPLCLQDIETAENAFGNANRNQPASPRANGSGNEASPAEQPAAPLPARRWWQFGRRS